MSIIKKLSEKTINQIAAGEVVDRPASVIKELVENAIDAKADRICIEIESGGKNLIRVTDNGVGMTARDLELCVERHATSKLNEEDINCITNLGFRGEALPSIGSIANLTITTRQRESEHGYCLRVHGNNKLAVIPAARTIGTTVEVKDLFTYAPVRLKFLRSDAAEKGYILSLIQNFGLCYPDIHFEFKSDNRVMVNYIKSNSMEQRLGLVLGEKFISNMLPISKKVGEYSLDGYVGLPTFTHNATSNQYIFINGRAIKDKQIYACIKASYANIMASYGHPALVINLQVDPYEIDVNVHPSKTEVRFRDGNAIKSFVINAIRQTLRDSRAEVSSQIAENAVGIIARSQQPYSEQMPASNGAVVSDTKTSVFHGAPATARPDFLNATTAPSTPYKPHNTMLSGNEALNATLDLVVDNSPRNLPLGKAIVQLHNTYIVAQSHDSLVIVDQHAAHERLVLEKYKENRAVKSQFLLVPQVVELGEIVVEHLLCYVEELAKIGIEIKRNGVTQIIIKSIPEFMKADDAAKLIENFAELAKNDENTNLFEQKRDEIYSTFACYSSIRAGRKLTIEEMDEILRQIEATPLAAQCNHGRPTFVKLDNAQLAKIFERI